MALRSGARYISRRLSSGGKILSEEEKAAENVYIKGPKPEEQAASGAKPSATESKLSDDASSTSTSRVSTDKYRNYAVLSGFITAVAAFGWYLKSSSKKPEEVQD
ncbi:hypothetical protein AMTRI_Chr06g196080 [Amborella trichopoda]